MKKLKYENLQLVSNYIPLICVCLVVLITSFCLPVSYESSITDVLFDFFILWCIFTLVIALYNFIYSLKNGKPSFKSIEFKGLNISEYLEKSKTTLEDYTELKDAIQNCQKYFHAIQLYFMMLILLVMAFLECLYALPNIDGIAMRASIIIMLLAIIGNFTWITIHSIVLLLSYKRYIKLLTPTDW